MESQSRNKLFTSRGLARSGVTAALYAGITMLLYPISYGGMQVRVSEALTLLPLFLPEAVPGLAVGCLIANIVGNGILDVVLGSAATLLAALLTFWAGKIRRPALRLCLGCVPPVVVNAVVVPFTYLASTELKALYFTQLLFVAAGQILAVCGLGIPLYFLLRRRLKPLK